MNTAEKSSFAELTRKIALAFFCLFMLDCSAVGAGRYLVIGPVTPRIALGVMTILFALPSFWEDRRKQIKNPFNWIVLAFLLYTGLEALAGRRNGNNPSVWASDIKGFAYVLLIPALQAVLVKKEDFKKVADAVLTGAAFQAVCCVTFNILLSFRPEWITPIDRYIWSISWGTILDVEYGAFRIFCKSSVYMAIACAILLGRIMQKKHLEAADVLLFFLYAEGLTLTYTRCIYLTTAAVFLLTLIYLLVNYPSGRVLWRTLLLLALYLGINFALELVLKQGVIQYAFARCFHWDLDAHFHLFHTWQEGVVDMNAITENTNNTRELTTTGLYQLIREKPVFGHGLGATSPLRDAADEYFYLDMLARYGIVGTVLYLCPVVWGAVLLIRSREKIKKVREPGLMALGLTGFLVASYFNPWMNAALGIAWYGVSLAAVSYYKLAPAASLKEEYVLLPGHAQPVPASQAAAEKAAEKHAQD